MGNGKCHTPHVGSAANRKPEICFFFRTECTTVLQKSKTACLKSLTIAFEPSGSPKFTLEFFSGFYLEKLLIWFFFSFFHEPASPSSTWETSNPVAASSTTEDNKQMMAVSVFNFHFFIVGKIELWFLEYLDCYSPSLFLL